MRRMCPRLIVVIICLLCGCTSVLGDTVNISVFPSGQSIALGSKVTVSLSIAGLGSFAAPSLGTFDLNLVFDPTVLSFNSAVFGDPILGDQLDPTGLGNTINFANPSTGAVELFDLSLDTASQLNSLQPSSFVLARVVFHTGGWGTSPLDLTANSLGDADGNSLTADLLSGSATVTAVPEPSSVFVLASGALTVGVLWFIRRLRKTWV